MATHDLRPAYAPRTTVARRGLFPPLAALTVLAISWWSAWFGGVWQATGGDNATVYAPAMNALLDAHLGAFFANLPVNGAGGSVLLRAPFALVGGCRAKVRWAPGW